MYAGTSISLQSLCMMHMHKIYANDKEMGYNKANPIQFQHWCAELTTFRIISSDHSITKPGFEEWKNVSPDEQMQFPSVSA